MTDRTHELLAGLAILVLGVGFRLWGVIDQPVLDDETLAAFSAESYVRHGELGPTMPFHPPLRNLILAASTAVFGNGAIGMRGPSLLFGILSIPLLWWLVLRLTRDRRAALLAALLLAVDPVHITFSRQAIQEVHTTFLFLAGVALFAAAARDDESAPRTLWLVGAGIAFGLATASKHHGLPPLLVCLGIGLYRALERRDGLSAARIGTTLALLPATVYLLTFIPWLRRGYGLSEWFGAQLALAGELLRHRGYATSSTIHDRPWQWFIRPLMGYGNFTNAAMKPSVTVAMGNPLVFMAVLPASIFLWLRERSSAGIGQLLILFGVSYLPLALSPRPVWLLSSLAVTPFAFALVARAVTRWTEDKRGWQLAYALAVVLVSLFLYPAAIGRGWDAGYLRPLVRRFSPHG